MARFADRVYVITGGASLLALATARRLMDEGASVVAGDLDHATDMIRTILLGTETGPARDMAVLSAAATLFVAGDAEDLAEGVTRATEAIDSGGAAETLDQLAAASHA